MTNIELVRTVFNQHFERVVEVKNGVFRGERQHKGKPYAVVYVDLSDEVVERAQEIHSYQEHLIGAEFFSSDNDLRWNSYLLFWAGPKSVSNAKFEHAKKQIESDRYFARKFVLNEHDLERRLRYKNQNFTAPASKKTDAAYAWFDLLRADSLEKLLELKPRTTTLDSIETGEAFEVGVIAQASKKPPTTDALATGMLRKLSIKQFRHVYQSRIFEFGDVNLIFAPNGMGKTSLLEAIEALYCGRVRRDPEADFFGISGELESTDGKRHIVELTRDAAALKARNMAWYGRTDLQAQAILQGFTRFNFLDTDAAFRLSSEQDPEQIQLDLGRLIVGSDTTRLWTFLSKLKEDVDTRLKAIEGQQEGDKLNVDFLENEIKRLGATPSASTSLRATFRTSVSRLRPKWAVPAASNQLHEQEKSFLIELKSAVDRALASALTAPTNKATLLDQLAKIKGFLLEVSKIQSSYKIALQEMGSAEETLLANKENHKLLVLWEGILLAGVPDLEGRIVAAEERIKALRVILPNYSVDAVDSFPKKYLSSVLKVALSDAKRESDLAQESFRTASRALSQAQELGETLVSLRHDLHDAATAVMGKTKNLTECPVCKTPHEEQDLAEKLLTLLGSSESPMSPGLRQHVHVAKEKADTAQRSLNTLLLLEKWQQSAGLASDLTCNDIFTQLQDQHEKLGAAILELQEAREAERTLGDTGIQLNNWKLVRANAQRAMPEGSDVNDQVHLHQAIELLAAKIEINVQENILCKKKVQTLANEATTLAIAIGTPTGTQMLPSQTVVEGKRLMLQAEARVAAAVEIEELVDFSAEVSYETLQSEVQACLLAYDKAAHAVTQETEADSALKLKRRDLDAARSRQMKHEISCKNLKRAAVTLTKIVYEHSLETITSEALHAIRSKVSDVFSQIHSPPQYALGNFVDGQLIVRRDNGVAHAVNQVSTGQRAALALSIFLAMNESAGTAPPVILIDDPVAHIDDLNALSFLDYLRDLVVNNRKQVFFATADARLAALFQRKFEFLGPQQYRKISLDLPVETSDMPLSGEAGHLKKDEN